MLQTEQDPILVRYFDELLYTLPLRNYGYTNSVQREWAVQQFLNSTNEEARLYFTEIKTEIDKTPTDQRTDLSKRFNLSEPPQEGR